MAQEEVSPSEPIASREPYYGGANGVDQHIIVGLPSAIGPKEGGAMLAAEGVMSPEPITQSPVRPIQSGGELERTLTAGGTLTYDKIFGGELQTGKPAARDVGEVATQVVELNVGKRN